MEGRSSRSRSLRAALALALVIAACARMDGAASQGENPRSLEEVVERAHFAFRSEPDGALVGAHATYDVRIERDGSLGFLPHGARTSLVLAASASPSSIGIASDGSALVARGSIRERLRNDGSGVEQSWEVDERPARLALRLRTAGMVYAGETETGHHFVDPLTKIGARYGGATWVDARGERTPIAIGHDGADLTIEVPQAVLDRSMYPAILDPTIGPELGIDAVVNTAGGPGSNVAIAPGPNGEWLAAWAGESTTVHARRIATNGALLGSELTLPLTGYPCLAFDSVNSRWLVVAAYSETKAVRIDTNGTVLDAPAIALGAGTYAQCGATFDGAKYVVGTATFAGGTHVWYVSAAGAILAPSPITLSSSYSPSRIACIPGSSCLVVWGSSGSGGVKGTLFDVNGAPIGTPVQLSVNATAVAQSVATDGTRYLATWSDGSGAGQTLRSARVSTVPAVLDSPSLSLETGMIAGAASGWDGQSFVVARGRSDGLTARRIGPTGNFVDAAPIVLASGSRLFPSIANGYIAWGTQTNTSSVYGSRLLSPPALADAPDGVTLAPRPNTTTRPRVAWSGSQYLVVWEDTRGTSQDIYSLRLSATGAPLAAVGTLVGKLAGRPVVASDGADFLVAYVAYTRELRLARVSGTTGALLDASPIAIPSDVEGRPAVTFNGESYVVVWRENKDDTLTNGDLYTLRISKAGVVLDPKPVRVAATTMEEAEPSVVSNGLDALAVWKKAANYFDSYVYGARIARNGTVLDPDGFPIGASFQQTEPVVAWNGTEYTVVWTDLPNLQGYDLHGARVTSKGEVLEPNGITLVTDTGKPSAPDLVALDGATLLLAWNEASTIRGLRVRRSPLEAIDASFVIVTEPGTSVQASLAPASPGSALAAYQRFDTTLNVPRVHSRFVSTGKPIGAPCATATECGSAFCADGVCCDAACKGICQSCALGGKCTTVAKAPDPDTCSGALSCSEIGSCKRANGQVCTLGVDCASGFCVDGLCCDQACNGGCGSCSDMPGKCTPRPLGFSGQPACAPARCNGRDLTCPAKCVTDEECADGYGCDRETGQCISGTVCTDPQTARAPNGTRSSCAPYACKKNACLTVCDVVTDCAFPAACNEDHRCVSPSIEVAGSSCAVARASSARSLPMFAIASLLFLLRRRRR